MSIDTVQATVNVPAVYPRPEPGAQSGRDPGRERRRGGKPGETGPDTEAQPQPVLNALGQVTGKTINTSA